MTVYLDGIAIPWPIEYEAGALGWVDVWACLQRESWMAFHLDGFRHRLHGNVTIVTVLAKPVWLP